jgi:3-methyladenine DNA glycosylase/8-oxoguanine DNA glycosylase
LTRAKAKAIAGLAEALSSGRLDCARLLALPPDEAQAALLAVPGIGPWTASYVRMRVLGDRDAFPAADLGVIKALEGLGVPRAGHIALAEGWRPWRAYATLHLWESLSA